MAEESEYILRYRIEGDEEVDNLRKKNTELFKSIEANTQAVNSLKTANKELSKDYAANSEQIAQNKVKIAELTSVNKTYNAELNNNIKTISSGVGSLKSMESEIAALNDKYTRLTKSQKENTVEGVAMGTKLKELREEYNNNKKAVGDYTSNVARYTDSIVETSSAVGFNTGILGKALVAYKEYAIAAQGAGKSTSVFKFALDLLAKNPIIAVLGVIVAIFFAFKKAINSSESATNKFT
jgi:chromosome segregation ATPase